MNFKGKDCVLLSIIQWTQLTMPLFRKFLGTSRARRNNASSSHIHGRPHTNLMSGPHHECEGREHHSLYSEST